MERNDNCKKSEGAIDNNMNKISFVVPCYYSEATIGLVVEDIVREFENYTYEYEIILVNDGSKDGTGEEIVQLSKKYSTVTAVVLSKNFGQDAALMAGYNCSTGDFIVSLDDDGQNPAKEAKKLVSKLEEGYDVAFGQYHKKMHSWFKNFGSKFNDIMAIIMLDKSKDLKLCSYFAMNRWTLEEVIKYQGAYPYIWGLILRTTDNITNVYIDHKAREIGKSTYSFRKMVAYWLNGFTAFSVKPLRFSGIMGVIVSCIGVIYLLFSIIDYIVNGTAVEGWASIMFFLIIFLGIQMMMIGLLGEYVGRTYLNANMKPQYIIRFQYSGECEEKIN